MKPNNPSFIELLLKLVLIYGYARYLVVVSKKKETARFSSLLYAS